jgi:hypothetical protein
MYSVDFTQEELLFLRELLEAEIWADSIAPMELYTSLKAINR